MEMKIKLCAALRDAAGTGEVFLPWTQGMTCGDVVRELGKKFQRMSDLLEHSFVAVNRAYAESRRSLMPEAEVAVFPPMSGG